jgi:hypothetical protein
VYDVVVFPNADERMNSHVKFIASVYEPAAVRLKEDYESNLLILSEDPYSFPLYVPLYPNFNKQLHFKLFSKRYRIVYEIIKNVVYIYDIQDCRQDSDKNLI